MTITPSPAPHPKLRVQIGDAIRCVTSARQATILKGDVLIYARPAPDLPPRPIVIRPSAGERSEASPTEAHP